MLQDKNTLVLPKITLNPLVWKFLLLGCWPIITLKLAKGIQHDIKNVQRRLLCYQHHGVTDVHLERLTNIMMSQVTPYNGYLEIAMRQHDELLEVYAGLDNKIPYLQVESTKFIQPMIEILNSVPNTINDFYYSLIIGRHLINMFHRRSKEPAVFSTIPLCATRNHEYCGVIHHVIHDDSPTYPIEHLSAFTRKWVAAILSMSLPNKAIWMPVKAYHIQSMLAKKLTLAIFDGSISEYTTDELESIVAMLDIIPKTITEAKVLRNVIRDNHYIGE